MQIKDFNSMIFKIIVSLGVFAGIFSIFLYFRGPHIRLASFDKPLEGSYSAGSILTLRFDRPVQQEDYSEYVKVSPKANFRIDTQNQSLALTFEESLQSDTEYKVSVAPEVIDQAGKKMTSEYTYQFKTPQATFYYLERDTYNNDLDGVTDAIFKKTVGNSKITTAYTDRTIRDFAVNSDYLVAVIAKEESDNDSLVVINLKTSVITEPSLYHKGRITNLQMPSSGGNILFSTVPDIGSVPTEQYPQFANLLTSYNADTDETNLLTDEKGNILQATRISVSKDGQIAIIRDDVLNYYAVSPFNDYDPVLLGTYIDDFGFANNDKEFLLRKNNIVVSYNIENSEVTDRINEDVGYSFIQQVNYQSNDIFLAINRYSTNPSTLLSTSTSSIFKYPNWEEDGYEFWSKQDETSENFQQFYPNYDGKLIAIRTSQSDCTYDNIGPLSECKESTITLVNSETKEEIESFRGLYLKWLP